MFWWPRLSSPSMRTHFDPIQPCHAAGIADIPQRPCTTTSPWRWWPVCWQLTPGRGWAMSPLSPGARTQRRRRAHNHSVCATGHLRYTYLSAKDGSVARQSEKTVRPARSICQELVGSWDASSLPTRRCPSSSGPQRAPTTRASSQPSTARWRARTNEVLPLTPRRP